MIIDIPYYEPPAVIEQAPLVQIKRRRNRSNKDRTKTIIPTWMVVGAVVIVLGRDGKEYKCTIAHVDYDRGQYYCYEQIP